ncbi:S6PP domain-containing protein [Haematococcus lacustris]|uniref:S6PP domain-containing protein n=1 Tax=Haematococcus lacustris TaxID=44745 RepID=A0A699ZD13_HAELA|nr:S6PP domain-containing protein [Haematococcus lacustris]
MQVYFMAASEQRPHKLSWVVAEGVGPEEGERLVAKLQAGLDAHGLTAKIIFSGGRDVDVISAQAGKGQALAFLMKRLAAAGCKPPHVQVNGDSGNDIDLFKVPGVVGCVVSNAHSELRQFAQQADKEAGPAMAGVQPQPAVTRGVNNWLAS